jgi:hypothetical protein
VHNNLQSQDFFKGFKVGSENKLEKTALAIDSDIKQAQRIAAEIEEFNRLYRN